MTVVTVHYSLALSPHTAHRRSSHPSSATHTFALTDPVSTPSAYYADLSRAVKSAIVVLGEDLTAWRDAVANDEKERESSTAGADSDGDGDEQGDDTPH
ncbi:hypothetical protein BS47DRAFT_181852 [Hydnum rufescens UP504]|uniref:Uncharacterized protein n=1 Tax=Hydnum rufescens UP504 TaxID=1448309 RepID=A0A9P6AP21_9AGAM|nr:hypothetical protein BS47DRAFT_181852 [Hydnum rufescens UP504]